ncbi:MAG: hypothetical protein ABI867_25020 [Kofleriaceae bacterium]
MRTLLTILLLCLLGSSALAQEPDSSGDVTFEAGAGVGLLLGLSDAADEALINHERLDLGVGWIEHNVALTARLSVAVSRYARDGSDSMLTLGLVGPSLQFWGNDHWWIGASAGLAVMFAQRISIQHLETSSTPVEHGPGGASAAATRSRRQARNTFNLAFEVVGGFFSVFNDGLPRSDVCVLSTTVLFGYQRL